MELSKLFRKLIDELIDPGIDTSSTLTKLEELVNNNGLPLEDFSKLLDLVFEPMVSSMVRNRIFSGLLVLNGDFLLPFDVLLRVLGSVGAPEVYYKKGKQHKLKRFSLTTQQKILQWTVNVLPFYGVELPKVLRRVLPILFGLLSYEFLRPYISTLIIAATAPLDDAKSLSLHHFSKVTTNSGSLRLWHVQLVVDLFERFPLDASLRALIFHFSKCDISSETRALLVKYHLNTSRLTNGGIAFPERDNPSILRVKDRADDNSLCMEIWKVRRRLDILYKAFEQNAKKRKVDPYGFGKTDLFNTMTTKDEVPISSIDSVSSLISNFENINFINPSSVFAITPSENHRYRNLYVSLTLLSSGKSSSTFKKLSSALKHHVLQTHRIPGGKATHLLKTFARYGMLKFLDTELESFLLEASPEAEGSILFLDEQIRLMPHFPDIISGGFLPVFDRIVLCLNDILVKKRPKAHQLLPQLASNLTLLIYALGIEKVRQAREILESIFPKFFWILDSHWFELTLPSQLSFLRFLNTSISVAIKDSSTWENSSVLIPHPSFIFRLVSSTHPIVVSEALGYMALIKKIKLPDTNDANVTLKNAYIMDSINFIWRDMAFKYERGTPNHGMYLHPYFLQRMSGLDFFSNSNLILIKSVGGVVQNPAFAYLCAEIVWKLEDKDPNITTRHLGPISETSIMQLQQDLETNWLQIGYQDLKISLLNHLDAMGLDGLADLLFTSLKPLVDRRSKSLHLPRASSEAHQHSI